MQSTQRQTLRLLAVLFSLALISASAASAATYTQEVSETYAIDPQGTLSVSNTNGHIRIVAWNGDDVQIDATKSTRSMSRDRADEVLDKTRVLVTETAGGLEIETELPRRKGLFPWLGDGGASVTYEIRVPRTVAVKARTVNGNVAIEEVAGSVEARSTNGRIRLVEVEGPADGRTTNGSVDAEMSRVGGQVKLASTNGAIRLELPQGEGVDLEAKTVNGRVRLDSQLGLSADRRGKRVSGALFGGGAAVNVSTVNGSITIGVGGSRI